MHNLNTAIDEKIYQKLKETAKDNKIPMAEITRSLLEDYFVNNIDVKVNPMIEDLLNDVLEHYGELGECKGHPFIQYEDFLMNVMDDIKSGTISRFRVSKLSNLLAELRQTDRDMYREKCEKFFING